jgi:hypothetical protein
VRVILECMDWDSSAGEYGLEEQYRSVWTVRAVQECMDCEGSKEVYGL